MDEIKKWIKRGFITVLAAAIFMPLGALINGRHHKGARESRMFDIEAKLVDLAYLERAAWKKMVDSIRNANSESERILILREIMSHREPMIDEK